MSQLFSELSFFKELLPNDIVINNDNNKKKIKMNCNDNKPGIYMIYRDNCHHCVSMKPILKNVSSMIDMDKFFISGMNTNNSDNRSLMRELDIKYVPKMYVVHSNGDIKDFSGDSHSENGLVSMLRSLLPSEREQSSVALSDSELKKRFSNHMTKQKTKKKKSKRKTKKIKKKKKSKRASKKRASKKRASKKRASKKRASKKRASKKRASKKRASKRKTFK
jgi:thiol-disulfide isomerase/thioredoxin